MSIYKIIILLLFSEYGILRLRGRKWKQTILCWNVCLFVVKLLCQILKSQCAYLSLLTMDLYVQFSVNYIDVGVASVRLHFSGKLSKLRLSFLLCNYVTYKRIIWQSTGNFFIFNLKMPFFEKITKAIYSLRFCQKWGSI